MSADSERYQCTIPDISETENVSGEEYTGPSGFEILIDLFSQNTCSYRVRKHEILVATTKKSTLFFFND